MGKKDPMKANKYFELFAAAQKGDIAKMRSLLDPVFNLDITAFDEMGATALHIATASGQKAAVALLLDPRIINAQDVGGNTALIIAASTGNAAIVDILVKAHADVNIQNNSNQTALLGALILQRPEIVQILVDKGADIHSKYNDLEMWEVAAGFAAERNNEDCVVIFQKLMEQEIFAKMFIDDSCYVENFIDEYIDSLLIETVLTGKTSDPVIDPEMD